MTFEPGWETTDKSRSKSFLEDKLKFYKNKYPQGRFRIVKVGSAWAIEYYVTKNDLLTGFTSKKVKDKKFGLFGA